MSSEKHSADILIVGGGIVGSAIAYQLAADGFKGKIVVFEKDPSYEFASTPLSAGGIRQQFATPVNILVGRYNVRFYENFAEHLEVDGERPDIGFLQYGYLFLGKDTGWQALQNNFRLQKKIDIPVEQLSPEEIQRRWPFFNREHIDGGVFCAKDGFLDPHSVMQAYAKKAKRGGVEYIRDEVVALSKSGDRISGLTTKSGSVFSAPVLVNAAGPHAPEICRMAGVDLPIAPVRRQLFIVDPQEALPEPYPLVILPSGTYFRPETGHKILVGKANEDEPAGFNFDWDADYFNFQIWPDLAQWVPSLEALKLERGWGGLYCVNQRDHNGIIGPCPPLEGFYTACGFSGHGVMQAPSTGKAISEYIRLGRLETIPEMTCLRPSRFAEGELVLEQAII